MTTSSNIAPRREFLQLGNVYNPSKHQIAGWYISEKLDGGRCFWDGGVTRGVDIAMVPWAGVIDPRTGNFKTKVKAICTGLWSRYGNPIAAPDWFLNALPACPLDGELWAGRGNFQKTMSTIRKDRPVDTEWLDIQFAVYSSPPLDRLFLTGEIKNSNMHCLIDRNDCEDFIIRRMHKCVPDLKTTPPGATFHAELAFLQAHVDQQGERCFMHRQVRLPHDEDAAHAAAADFVQGVLNRGGEGAIIRNGNSIWTPKRFGGVLKYKPVLDADAVVTGFTSGRRTTRGSRLLGKIGALVTEHNGQRLELAGLTDAEREFATEEMREYAAAHPGEEMPDWFRGTHFNVGDVVTFTYRELTDGGVAKEARYLRKRGEV